MSSAAIRSTLLHVIAVLLLALAFLGTRPIWDPDEGRYTNVALNMVESGDWIHPARSHEAGHWTKPPLTYWAIASSVSLFGYNTWAARLPIALAYLLSVWLCTRISGVLEPGSERLAGVIYATLGLPLLASQLVTTDYLLAAAETAAVYAYVRARFGSAQPHHPWVAWMWFGFGLAFLTKGPPALLPLTAIVAYERLHPRGRRIQIGQTAGIALFLLIALGWFAWVSAEQPVLLEHFVGSEVARRVVGDGFGRNAEWYGWIAVYLPTLVLGSLPWTARAGSWLRADIGRWLRTKREPGASPPASVFLLLWIGLPLLILCVSRSRLPLYALPLFVPLALGIARHSHARSLGVPRMALMVWVALVLALRLGASTWPTHKDASAWAAAIRSRAQVPVTEVVFVEDMARYGLHLHLGAEVEKVSLQKPESRDIDRVYDHDFLGELAESGPELVYITPLDRYEEARAVASGAGYALEPLGTPFRDRVLFVAHAREREDASAVAAR